MKNVFLFALLFVCGSALAQQKKDSIELLAYNFRWFGNDPCKNCPPEPKNKKPFVNPYQKYTDDKSLWEWRTIKLSVGKPQKVYDLKPQYKDTITLNDGTIMEVPIWFKEDFKKLKKTTP
jgi:hypothetical protein